MSLRILFQMCLPEEPRAAGRQQSVRVCYHLAKAGAHVSLHVWTDYFTSAQQMLDYFGLPAEPNLEVVLHRARLGASPSRRRIWFKGMAWHMRRLLALGFTSEKRRYDLYYGRGRRYPGVHAFFKRVLGYKVLFECHEIHYLDGAAEEDVLRIQPKIDWERLAYRKADGVIFLTSALKHLVAKKWGEVPRITVIPSGGTLRVCDPRPADRAVRDIYFIGNPYLFSGIDDLVSAVAHLPETMRLHVVGGAPEGQDLRRVRALVEKLDLGERVELVGYVQPTTLGAYYDAADVVVMPLRVTPRSNYFMSPLKMFEYMTSRRAIVASDVPVSREVLRDGENALLVEPENPAALAEAIGRLAQTPGLADRIAEASYRDAAQYGLEHKCKRMLAFMEEIVGRPGSGRPNDPRDVAQDGAGTGD